MAELKHSLKNTSDGVAFVSVCRQLVGSDAVVDPVSGVANANYRQGNVIPFSGVATVAFGSGTLARFMNPAGSPGTNEVRVPKGYKAFITYALFVVKGGSAWAGGTDIRISDDNGTPVDWVTIATSALTANAVISTPLTTLAGVTQNTAAMAPVTGGFTAERGLVVRATGTFTAGSNIEVFIEGFYRRV
jgi:hypothetical protein